MARQRITELFPFLIPLRQAQRNCFFYLAMRLDHQHYAKEQLAQLLPHEYFSSSSLLINEESGQDIIYQYNKVHNLRLAIRTVDRLLIRPGETFSFWQLVRHAEDPEPYKDGLCIVNGELKAVPGGGLCQLSNLLFWLFLHTPLTLVEHHAHTVEAFPVPPSEVPQGAEATVSEGWLDLKVKNETQTTFQLSLTLDESHLRGRILSDMPPQYRFHIVGRDLCYYKEGQKVMQRTTICQQRFDLQTKALVSETSLYQNICEIAYQLPEHIKVLPRLPKGPS